MEKVCTEWFSFQAEALFSCLKAIPWGRRHAQVKLFTFPSKINKGSEKIARAFTTKAQRKTLRALLFWRQHENQKAIGGVGGGKTRRWKKKDNKGARLLKGKIAHLYITIRFFHHPLRNCHQREKTDHPHANWIF